MRTVADFKLLNSSGKKALGQIKTAKNFHIPKGMKNYQTKKECSTVYDYLISIAKVPDTKQDGINKFWLDISDCDDAQGHFLRKLAILAQQWILRSAHIETPSELRVSIRSLRKNLKKIQSELSKSPYLNAQISDVFSDILETEFADYIDDEDIEPNWDRLKFVNLLNSSSVQDGSKASDLLDSFDARLGQCQAIYPYWYPRKIREKSAEKVFAVHAVRIAMDSISYKGTYAQIADFASLLSRDTVDAEEVRAMLRKWRSQKIK